MSSLLLIGLGFGAVFVPLTIDYILDGKALKAEEKELRKLRRIDEIESKYDVEITDDSLTMPKEK